MYYLHSTLCLRTSLIEYLTVLLEYLDLLQTGWLGTANIWEGLGPARHAFWLHQCLKLLYLVFTHFSYFSFRLFLFYACTQPIILELFLPKL